MDTQERKQKLQFSVSDFYFNIFENVRRKRFASKNTEQFLEQLFIEWLNKLTQNGKVI